jgi:hypothetical protein
MGIASVRRAITTFALAVFVAACGLVVEPAPSGQPAKLDEATSCSDNANHRWKVEGVLRADVSVVDPLSGPRHSVTALEITGVKTGASPEPDPSQWIVHVVSVRWPSQYSGVGLANREIAVVDATGHLVAMTGRTYQLDGVMIFGGAVGGDLFGKTWPGALDVCLPS